MIKILTVLGARPQFIKAAAVSRAIRERGDLKEVIVHTGQHFDANMSDVFFEQLDIPKPDYNLGIASLAHGAMTGRMLEQLESLIQVEKPDWVMVYGDTNSTLAGALAAAKLHVSVAHVEAGLRSHNPLMPEEVNRVLTDRVSTLLLCPTDTAVKNLETEGFPFIAPRTLTQKTEFKDTVGHAAQRIENVGDVMFDAVLFYKDLALKTVNLAEFGLNDKGYALCTIHRQENTDNSVRLRKIFAALREINEELPVVLPLHPRTRAKVTQYDSDILRGLRVLEPLPYLQMQRLQMSANLILTDSGGMQKEAYFHRVPCITLRDETEWVETVETGWNKIVGSDYHEIINCCKKTKFDMQYKSDIYGHGKSSESIVNKLRE